MNMRNQFLCLLTVFLISSHLQAEVTTAIPWFKGSVEQAFDTARKQSKPLFLYWGAQWCPPCNQLKATVFKQPSFINKTHRFIPVYLDADTEQAQVHGERFNVMGYPTLIMFTPQGMEFTRIRGGMGLERYANVLDLVLNDTHPVKRLTDKILDQNYRPKDKELQLLAYYSWRQDAGQATTGRDKRLLFRKFSDLTPDYMSEENSHFNAEYLLELVEIEGPLSTEVRLEAMRRLSRILDSPVNTRSNLEFVVYGVKDVIDKLTANSTSAAKHMADKWDSSLSRLADHEQLTAENRLELLRGTVELFELRQQPVPISLQRQIRYAVSESLSSAGSHYRRTALTCLGYSLLQASEQPQAAEKLLYKAQEYDSNTQCSSLETAEMVLSN